MKKALILTTIMFVSMALRAQRLYYIYLQSESGKPFYVKMNEKIYNAASTGYLILSDLHDSTYMFRIGFPGDSRDYQFSCTVAGRDHGFLVKDFKEKGWGLFDLQTLKVYMPETHSGSGGLSYVPKKQVTPFALMLAKAVGDPTLLQTAIFKEQEKKAEKPVLASVTEKEKQPQPIQEAVVSNEPTKKVDSSSMGSQPPVIAKADKPVEDIKTEIKKTDIPVTVMDSTAIRESDLAREASLEAEKKKLSVKSEPPLPVKQPETPVEEKVAAKDPPAKKESYPASSIRIRSESSTTEGFGLVFIDEYGSGTRDTIRLLIPNEEARDRATAKKNTETPARRFLDFDSGSTPVSEKETAIETSKKVAGDQEMAVKNQGTQPVKDSPDTALSKATVPQKEAALEIAKMAAVDKDTPKDKKQDPVEKPNVTPVTNTAPSLPQGVSCKKAATEEDFLELRKRMASETEEVKMVDEAEAFFRNTCFSTEQIKNLGVLFLRDVWKFRFFDSAYPFVTDPQNFPQLKDQLSDAYYVERFQSILKKGF